jgi:hypothetical protein
MASTSDALWASVSIVLYAGMTCKTVSLLQYGYDKYGKYDDKYGKYDDKVSLIAKCIFCWTGSVGTGAS